MDDLGKLLARIDSILASEPKKFASEREWCRKAGVSDSYIGAIRTKRAKGESTTAKVDVIAKLARAAGVTIDYLMGGDAVPVGPTHVEHAVPREASPNLSAALEAFPWGEVDLAPDLARRVVEQVRREAFAGGGVDLPQSYWHARVARLADEVLGRAKSVPRRANVVDVDLNEESPELREHRARRPRS
jgi:transcriptional regulator with XRE-family HTH domain